MFRILRGLGSRALPCGCLVGVYETYATQTIAVIDAKGSFCDNKTHRVDAYVDFSMVASTDLVQPPSTMPTMNR
ncbi:MAG TPA: hypothetical protein VGZ27_13575 [Vicinamibacterales bacterium]|jgi:hypothetical protein|nr:hypothetical protein [Vicinamibacterales bacterium]